MFPSPKNTSLPSASPYDQSGPLRDIPLDPLRQFEIINYDGIVFRLNSALNAQGTDFVLRPFPVAFSPEADAKYGGVQLAPWITSGNNYQPLPAESQQYEQVNGHMIVRDSGGKVVLIDGAVVVSPNVTGTVSATAPLTETQVSNAAAADHMLAVTSAGFGMASFGGISGLLLLLAAGGMLLGKKRR